MKTIIKNITLALILSATITGVTLSAVSMRQLTPEYLAQQVKKKLNEKELESLVNSINKRVGEIEQRIEKLKPQIEKAKSWAKIKLQATLATIEANKSIFETYLNYLKDELRQAVEKGQKLIQTTIR